MKMTEITGISGTYSIPGVQSEAMAKKKESGRLADIQKTFDYSQHNSDKPKQILHQDIHVREISFTFNKHDDFKNIGKESSLGSLDIEKAISDMKRDKIFEEYQYFIGGKPDLENDGEADGNVFLK